MGRGGNTCRGCSGIGGDCQFLHPIAAHGLKRTLDLRRNFATLNTYEID